MCSKPKPGTKWTSSKAIAETYYNKKTISNDLNKAVKLCCDFCAGKGAAKASILAGRANALCQCWKSSAKLLTCGSKCTGVSTNNPEAVSC